MQLSDCIRRQGVNDFNGFNEVPGGTVSLNSGNKF
jgi:hypothetical protein